MELFKLYDPTHKGDYLRVDRREDGRLCFSAFDARVHKDESCAVLANDQVAALHGFLSAFLKEQGYAKP